ncbi:hypothetical protein V5E97_27985 [Singulisphaera sp. Ch08]|uniref:DUF4175 family protein n=1 Tax=Singulisphaera sp. Ch08 TaxID=3120278 RepID=A0AAU7CBR4_9BACT
MSLAGTQNRLELPESLRTQLRDYRRRVWTVKMAEAVFAACFGVVAAFLLMFVLDRVWDTPGWPRVALFVVAALACALVPLGLYRWVGRNRRFDQLARLLARKHPHFGDELLGVIELVHSDSEQTRSRALCEAAVRQVTDDAGKRDLNAAVPNPRHRTWAWLAAVPATAALGLFLLFPAAASNAWSRLIAPWRPIPRYTFAAITPLPDHLVVPHGEPFTAEAKLAAGTAWRPVRGEARLDGQGAVSALLRDDLYAFDLPAMIAPGPLEVRVGDWLQRVRVEPTLRPELTSIVANVALPKYLGRPEPLRKDVRGGSVALVKGSQATFTVTASRDLSSARVNGQGRTPAGATVASPLVVVEGARNLEFQWKDQHGLAGKAPFTLAVNGRDDEPPTVSCENMPRNKVILDTELLAFKVHVQDDFGIKRVGLEWHGVENPLVASPAAGEQMLAAGGSEKENLDLNGTFTAKTLGIEPQPINVRVFAEDYLPGRPRAYSPTYTFYVLNAEQHAIWIAEQLSKWHRQSLEVRDREMQLYETNKQLRDLAADELDRPETRKKVESQAAAERANGRRLSMLVGSGEDLVKQASRNPEIGVGHLERWAEMLQILKDISTNRMPSVAELLKEAAQAPSLAANTTGNKAPTAGQVRAAGAGAPSEPKKSNPAPSAVPRVVDMESSQNSPAKKGLPPTPPGGNSKPKLGLAQTTVMGKGSATPPPPPPPAAEKVDEAVNAQRDLLAEFEKIADELNRVLANLEGSTLVKRLKAASRVQLKIGGRLGDFVGDAFGLPESRIADAATKELVALAEQEAKGSQNVSMIMDDLQAYFERRQFVQFKAVLDEMKKEDVVGGLRQIGDDLKKEQGMSIAQCEFWSDSLDRWAEDLVDPACKGTCPGSKSKSSLPPSIVLEVLQILEGEVNLREETRVAEQAKPALVLSDYSTQAGKLSGTQKELAGRVEKVTGKIRELPDAEQEFAYEIALLGQVGSVMDEATGILLRPETGNPAVAAETEAIELLLKSKRINPKGGGGGGSSPGGGGTGTTQDSALALLGVGLNEKEVKEDHGVSQATGDSGPSLPEEFRAGLDEYFNRLERAPAVR